MDKGAESLGLAGDQKTVGATFRHDTSRNLNPQLHTHCVIASMVQAMTSGAPWSTTVLLPAKGDQRGLPGGTGRRTPASRLRDGAHACVRAFRDRGRLDAPCRDRGSDEGPVQDQGRNIKVEVEVARQRIASVAGVPPQAVKISIDLAA